MRLLTSFGIYSGCSCRYLLVDNIEPQNSLSTVVRHFEGFQLARHAATMISEVRPVVGLLDLQSRRAKQLHGWQGLQEMRQGLQDVPA